MYSQPTRRPDWSLFLQRFLARPAQVASIWPSSTRLERRITRHAGLESAQVVVELGPGTGGTTRALLAALPPEARLIAVEIDAELAARVRGIDDPRLTVCHASAAALRDLLAHHGHGAADVVISGIPFSTMAPALGARIVSEVHGALRPGGRFVAYQLRDNVDTLARPLFGAPAVAVELVNVPPMRVFRYLRPAAHP